MQKEIQVSWRIDNSSDLKPIFTIQMSHNPEHEIIKIVNNFKNVPSNQKIFVIQKIESFNYNRSLEIINNLKDFNFSLPPERRHCLCFVYENSFLYQIYKSSPVTNEDEQKVITKKIEHFTKNNTRFVNIATCLPRSCYLITINCEAIDKIDTILKNFSEFDEFNRLKGCRPILKLFNLFKFFDLHLGMSSNLSKIKLFINKDEVLENNTGNNKEEKGLKICKNKENVIFEGSKSKFIYKFDQVPKESGNVEQFSLSKTELFNVSILNNNLEELVFEIEEDQWNELKDIFSKCSNAIKDNFCHELLFFRFLKSQNQSIKIIKQILLSGNGNSIFFLNLCQILNIIKKDELIILITKDSLNDSYLKNLKIDEIALKVEMTMENLNDGIIYLMSLCLFFEVENKIINDDIFDLNVFYDLETVAKCIYMKKYSISDIDDLAIPQNIFEEVKFYEVFKELGNQKRRLCKRTTRTIATLNHEIDQDMNFCTHLLDRKSVV